SVITNVGVAHLETFGSRDAIARTKSTLVKRTRKNGTAVLNADDERVAAMADLREDLDIIRVGLGSGSVQASGILYDREGMQFTVSAGGESEPFRMKLLGAHNVQNMLLAIGVAGSLGMRLTTMALAAARVEPIEHRLELKRHGDLTIIDDAFNSNPVGAQNAVDMLARFDSGRRIIITPGMIELGEIQEEKNRAFGQQIGEADLDLVILVGQKQTEPILEGIRSVGFDGGKVQIAESLYEANRLMRDFARPGDVVLYENDLPDSYDE
ncbi:MAG TPA: Mur ligase family protein, partial [Fodinibius sp.]|nr:Mur ligase family protein [Fodinibius sp.]